MTNGVHAVNIHTSSTAIPMPSSSSTCTTCATTPVTSIIGNDRHNNNNNNNNGDDTPHKIPAGAKASNMLPFGVGMAHGRLLMELIDAQPHTTLRPGRRHTPCDSCTSYRWARTFNHIYDRLMAHDIGSRIHHSHFATWPRIFLTISLITATACGLVGLRIAGISDPDFTSTEYGVVNNAAFYFCLSTIAVLYGVLTGLDYTRFGTIVELIHNVTELYLAVASFGYDKYRYQWTIVASTALFMLQSIPILRLSIKEQFNWAGISSALITIFIPFNY